MNAIANSDVAFFATGETMQHFATGIGQVMPPMCGNDLCGE